MKLPEVIPPDDLLKQIDGIETRLRRGRPVGLLGALAFITAALQVTALVLNSPWFKSLANINMDEVVSSAPIVIPIALVVLAIFLVNWNRIWIKESEEPFRYTYSVGPFEPVKPSVAQPRLAALQHDLSQQLSERIARLSVLDDSRAGTNHIGIGGEYLVRQQENTWTVEITPWVRIGPANQPATLAHAVRFTYKGEQPVTNGAPETSKAPPLTHDEYEHLRERVYYGVASHIYKQIRSDVQRKIGLLPTHYFRTAAYFYEAEDYARSNTLDAYQDASFLYRRAIELIDPARREPPDSRWRRALLRIKTLWSDLRMAVRGRLVKFWPRFGRVQLLLARAELGYANMLLYRRILAGLSGSRVTTVFEARPIAARAVARLRRLPPDLPLRRETLFDAYVTLALVRAYLGSHAEARAELDKARTLWPPQADLSARYLFAYALANPGFQFGALQRAVELDPKFEVAAFELALRRQMEWTNYPHLEPSTAELVRREYNRVLSLNPGNVAACANAGYMLWLLSAPGTQDALDAKTFYERGRQYKEIKPETFVSDVDSGLARIAAEDGDFDRAYEHYRSAVSAHISQGVQHSLAYLTVNLSVASTEFSNQLIVARFKLYRDRVETKLQEQSSTETSKRRILDNVRGFMLEEYGTTCFNHYMRSGDDTYLAEAKNALVEAVTVDDKNALSQLYLGFVLLYQCASLFRARQQLDRDLLTQSLGRLETARSLEPNWADARLAVINLRSVWAILARQEASRARESAENERKEANRLKERVELASTERVPVQMAAPGRPRELAREPLFRDLERTGRAQNQRRADRYAREAQQHLERAEQYEKDALDWREKEHEAYSETTVFPRALVPHAWLPADGLGRVKEDGTADELRWERELEEHHVSALIGWCGALLEAKNNGFFEGKPIETVPDAQYWLDLIKKHFWADDYSVLVAGRDLAEKREDAAAVIEYNRAIFNNRKHWLERDLTADQESLERSIELVGLKGDAEFRAECRREAVDGLRRAMRAEAPLVLFGVAKELERLGLWNESLATYRRGLEFDAKRSERTRPEADFRLGIVRSLWHLRRCLESLDELRQIERPACRAENGWRSTFVENVLKSGHQIDLHEYWSVHGWLSGSLQRARAARQLTDQLDCASALKTLLSERYTEETPPPDSWQRPIVQRAERYYAPPIAVAFAHNVFPLGEQDPRFQRMLRLGLPNLRERIKATSGVIVSGPLSLQQDETIALSEYRIELGNLTVARGRLGQGKFTTDVSACARRGLKGELLRDAHGEPRGVWLADAADLDLVHTGGMRLMDAADFLMWELEAVLRQRLHEQLSIEDVGRLLDRWVADNADNHGDAAVHLRREAVPNAPALVTLTRILRTLLREHVPLVDLENILRAFRDASKTELDGSAAVERIRTALRRDLPGNDRRRSIVALSDALEEALANRLSNKNGRRVRPGAARDGHDPIEILRSHLAGRSPDDTVLLVEKPGLRSGVRQLLEVHDTQVPVLAATELVEWVWPAERIELTLNGNGNPGASG